MNLQHTFNKSLYAGSDKGIPECPTIHSVADFDVIIAKEKARADRNSHLFSLVSFEIDPSDSSKDSVACFAYYLKNRIRITDQIGWLDTDSIGVLLFNSSRVEAEKFIEKILLISPPNICYKYTISTYPAERTEHLHAEGVHPGTRENHHSMNASSSFSVQSRATSANISQKLHPVFFHKVSVWKRLSDICLSLFALIVFSPLFLIIAITLKLTSKGPILYKQQRAGLGGVPFTMLKFRTMKAGAEEMKSELQPFNERTGPVFKMGKDPRVTRIGKILRQWSLDELPNFINVLKGEMSLVGPRPPTFDEVERYHNWHNYRLEMRPGITCIWQVYARHEKSFDNWVRLDIKYRQEQSFLLDLKLLALTLPAVLSRRGAC
jgi:lipopolysaccharide/colanic/teichoic acid biosynthesis glycosyltransferase